MEKAEEQEKEVFLFLEQLNEDIKAFIHKSVEASSETKGRWSALRHKFNPLRCWEIKHCRKKECPAYQADDHRCWLHAGTTCDGQVQGEFAKKYTTCFDCDVFQSISKEPLRALYENINILIFHLQERASKFQELAIRDPLTGLYNRHFFNEVIEHEMARSGRRNEPVSFILIDLDDFKEVNDSLGHLTGDKILIETATILTNIVRKADLAFRFGGDEFLILMGNTGVEKRKSMVSRLLQAVEEWNGKHAGTYGCKLSISIGCSTCLQDCDVHLSLSQADRDLYAHKREKKNGGRCVLTPK